ncbi:hypothetical protein [Formosa sediminum]|uniref:hypothetical protein n=1 Tax=Formosa sediminum TaxID=2594004 RepID=UPI001FE5033D|nr:hypothetical protein [Formosa sediminum]
MRKPMIKQLIERTNTTEFYQNGHLHLTELKGLIGQYKTIDLNGIYADLYLPYIKMKILTDHPLLWTYNKAE